MVERGNSNNVLLFPVRRRNQNILMPLITEWVHRGTTIMTDGALVYQGSNGITGLGRQYHHLIVNHRVKTKLLSIIRATMLLKHVQLKCRLTLSLNRFHLRQVCHQIRRSTHKQLKVLGKMWKTKWNLRTTMAYLFVPIYVQESS